MKEWNSSEFRDFQIEELPVNIPEPFGIGFLMRDKVDSYH